MELAYFSQTGALYPPALPSYLVGLAIIIQSFAARRCSSEVILRGIAPESLKRIYEFNYYDKVHDDVGMIFIEITQPTWQSVDRMARVGVCVDRKAELLSQPDRLTNRIEEWLRSLGGVTKNR